MPNLQMTGRSESGSLVMSALDDRPGAVVLKREPEEEGGEALEWVVPADVLRMLVEQATINAVMASLKPQAPPAIVVPDGAVTDQMLKSLRSDG